MDPIDIIRPPLTNAAELQIVESHSLKRSWYVAPTRMRVQGAATKVPPPLGNGASATTRRAPTEAELLAALRPPDHEPSASSSSSLVSTHSQPKPTFHLYLPRLSFCLCWWLVLGVHVVIGVFAVSFALLNRYLQQDGMRDSFSALQVPYAALGWTAHSFFVVSACHWIAIARMIRNSIQARCLTFHQVSASSRTATTPKKATTTLSRMSDCISCLLHPARVLYTVFTTTWRKVLGMNGYFGLNGPYFEIAFTIRESIEIMLQTYQAYNLSRSVPRVWINQLAVGAIILNCIASPAVQAIFRNNIHIRKGRLLNFVQDGLLDFACTVGIPCAVLLPYVLAFDRTIEHFPPELLMDDVWYANSVSELRQVLVTSVPDYFATLLPQLSLLGCLMTVKSVIRHRPTSVQCSGNHSVATGSRDEKAHQSPQENDPSRTKLVWRNTATGGRIHMAQRLNRGFPWRTYQRHWGKLFINGHFVLWGIVVLVLHLQARQMAALRMPGCRQYMRAWHASGFACSVMNLNCHMHQIQGSRNETSAVLSRLDRSALRILVISHCPALHVPPVTTEFARLKGLEFFNNSLVDWPEEAALRQETQPEVGYVYLILTNWTTFPSGIYHDQLPHVMTHLFVVSNNMTELPIDIGTVWGSREWIYLVIESLPALQALPPSFCQLSGTLISLANTGIEILPENCFLGIMALVVSGCPLRELPATGFDLDLFISLDAEHTELTALPDWYTGWVLEQPLGGPYFAATLFGSPVCSDDTIELLSNLTYWDATCGTDINTTSSLYPWEYVLPQRQFEGDWTDDHVNEG